MKIGKRRTLSRIPAILTGIPFSAIVVGRKGISLENVEGRDGIMVGENREIQEAEDW